MQHYSLKQQRSNFILTLRNDAVLNASPKDRYIHFDQVAAGKKAFKKIWGSPIFRLFFNIILPFSILFIDFILTFKYIYTFLIHEKKTINSKRFFIGHDRRLFTLSEKFGLQQTGDVWIAFLNEPFSISNENQTAEIWDFVTLDEILKSYIQSIIIHGLTPFTLGYKYLFLSYKSYEWFLLDFALRHIPTDTELVYSYICDRNAILIDKLPHTNKVLIQHGTMHFGNKTREIPYLEWHPEKGFYIWNSLYKSSPSKVYCFTEIDKWALSNSVILNEPIYICTGYGFNPAFKPSKKAVLIVSNYYKFADREEFLLQQLQGLDIEIFLKNHPSHSNSLYDEMRSKYRFTFIEGMDTNLPDVDILISYDSTLAYEYASIGTKVLYYGHFDIDNVREILANELNIINVYNE